MNNKDVEAALQSGLIIEMIDLIKRTPIDQIRIEIIEPIKKMILKGTVE